MKNILVTLMFIIIAFLCKGQTENFLLRYNLEPGKVYSLSTDNETAILRQIRGMLQVANDTLLVEVALSSASEVLNHSDQKLFKPMNVHDDSILFEVMFTDLTLETEIIEDQSIFDQFYQENNHFDNNETQINSFSDITSSILFEPFFINLSKTGEIQSTEGINRLLKIVSDNIPELNEEEKLFIQNFMNGAINEETFDHSFGSGFIIFPEHSVKEGDQWEVKTFETMDGLSFEINTIYELTNVTDSLYHITTISEIEFSFNEVYRELLEMGTTLEMDGEIKFKYEVDRNTGWIISGSGLVEYTAEINFSEQYETIPGMKSIFSTTSKTEMRGEILNKK